MNEERIDALERQVNALEKEVLELKQHKDEIIANFHAFMHVVKKRLAEGASTNPARVALPDEDEEI